VANPRGGDNSQLHTEVFEMLLEKVRNDAYPSTTQLDMIEHMLGEGEVEQYADVLLDKVRDETYPSLDHLRRLLSLM